MRPWPWQRTPDISLRTLWQKFSLRPCLVFILLTTNKSFIFNIEKITEHLIDGAKTYWLAHLSQVKVKERGIVDFVSPACPRLTCLDVLSLICSIDYWWVTPCLFVTKLSEHYYLVEQLYSFKRMIELGTMHLSNHVNSDLRALFEFRLQVLRQAGHWAATRVNCFTPIVNICEASFQRIQQLIASLESNPEQSDLLICNDSIKQLMMVMINGSNSSANCVEDVSVNNFETYRFVKTLH